MDPADLLEPLHLFNLLAGGNKTRLFCPMDRYFSNIEQITCGGVVPLCILRIDMALELNIFNMRFTD